MGLVPHARPPEGWMSVYVTNSVPDAYIVVGRLDVDGIRSWVQQEAAGAALGLTVGQMGAVQVLVNPEDFEAAMAILAVDYSDEDWVEDGMDAEDDDDEPAE
jgi:hypothetical protein